MASPQIPVFTEITEQVGLRFRNEAGRDGSYWVPETIGGGAAVFDYNGDGRFDVFLVNGGDRKTTNGPAKHPPNRLFRQESDGRFSDVTDAAGVGGRGYGMGAAVGDIDNDGDLDLYVTNYGRDLLYRNNGDGSFADVSDAFGITGEAWSASAAFLDYDRDGWLDLYVTHYLDYDAAKQCTDAAGRPDYCGPNAFPGVSDTLYRNVGGKRFEDVSRQSGITSVADSGLGVVCLDFNDDDWIDIYVANDADPNNLWINQRDGTFRDEARMRGCAVNRQGIAEAGMGIGFGDANADGDLDLFVTHLIGETNIFYRGLRGGVFEDATAESGLGVPSLPYTGFGTAMFDADNDGDLDIAVVNGAVKRRPAALTRVLGWWNDFAEPRQFFLNDGTGRFTDVSAAAGPLCTQVEVGRALIPADFDDDGDLDLLVTNIDGPARLFRNDTPPRGHWLAVRAMDPALRRDAVGARVTVITPKRRHVGWAVPFGGYLSGAEPTIHFGLADASAIDHIEVRWPDGTSEQFPGEPTDRRITLEKSRGTAPP